MTSWIAAQDDPHQAAAMIRRFGALTRSTPSLGAYRRDMTDRLVAATAAPMTTVRLHLLDTAGPRVHGPLGPSTPADPDPKSRQQP
ncbi:hypothetical protein [Streptomyces sviceus]|uniref:hypothetical protein n=1 Tax=Streptomyces sviceus TaxID=285530 RepID=UPI0036E3DC7E